MLEVLLAGALIAAGCTESQPDRIPVKKQSLPAAREVLTEREPTPAWPMILPTGVDHIYRVTVTGQPKAQGIASFVVLDVTLRDSASLFGRSERRLPMWMLDAKELGAAGFEYSGSGLEGVPLTTTGLHEGIASSVIWVKPPRSGQWTEDDLRKAIEEVRAGARPGLLLGDGVSTTAPMTELEFDTRRELDTFRRMLATSSHLRWRGKGNVPK